MNIKKPVLMN